MIKNIYASQSLDVEDIGLSAHSVQDGLFAIGNTSILSTKKMAFFCSVKSPGDIILKTYDLAKELRDKSITVISGFHSPMEQECLRILLCGKQPIIICPARSIENMRIPKDWQGPLGDNRLLILSPFNKEQKRTTAQTAKIRNEFVAAVADKIFVAYAAPNSKTEKFCSAFIDKGKPIYTLNSPANTMLINIGVKTITSDIFECSQQKIN